MRIDQRNIEYVKYAKAEGKSDSEIREEFRRAGYDEKEAEGILRAALGKISSEKFVCSICGKPATPENSVLINSLIGFLKIKKPKPYHFKCLSKKYFYFNTSEIGPLSSAWGFPKIFWKLTRLISLPAIALSFIILAAIMLYFLSLGPAGQILIQALLFLVGVPIAIIVFYFLYRTYTFTSTFMRLKKEETCRYCRKEIKPNEYVIENREKIAGRHDIHKVHLKCILLKYPYLVKFLFMLVGFTKSIGNLLLGPFYLIVYTLFAFGFGVFLLFYSFQANNLPGFIIVLGISLLSFAGAFSGLRVYLNRNRIREQIERWNILKQK